MLIALIRKDDATEVPREVADIEAARALNTADMPVFILEGGAKIPVEEYGRELAAVATESAAGETIATETETPSTEMSATDGMVADPAPQA